MNITIQRGTNEIGGSLVSIEHDNTRILIDAGTPLDNSPAYLPENISSYDGVIISHSHQDHHGLIEQLPKNTSIYTGKLIWAFIQSQRIFTKRELLSQDTVKFIKAGNLFNIGSISITPYLVDHSSPEAFGFLITADNKSVYYSGDFRNHGWKQKTFDYLCSRLPKNMNALILEGTMIQRSNLQFSNEAEVEQKIYNLIKENTGLTCISCSSQNIDRIVSAYKASKKCKKIFVVDIYTAWIMRLARMVSKNIPDISWEDIKVLSRNLPARGYYMILKEHREYFGNFINEIFDPKNEINVDEITSNPSKYVLRLNDTWTKYVVEKVNEKSVTYIYSQWEGYLDEKSVHYNEKAASFKEMDNVNFKLVHTSGHAVLEDLKNLVSSTCPQRVIPIHTEYKHTFADIFDNSLILEDKQTYSF